MRGIDSDFAPDEQLYLRLNPTYFPKEYVAAKQVPLNEVRFPDFSVNRGKYSQPEDVLKPRGSIMELQHSKYNIFQN